MSSRRSRPNLSKTTPNLRKDSPNLEKTDIDLEKKGSEPSQPEIPITFEYEIEDGLTVTASAGGIGIGREYELSDSDSLEFSAEFDWSIIDVDISKTAEGTGVSGEVGLPGDLLGIGAGVSIDLATGEISGGEISAEVGTVGVSVGVSSDGCEVSVGISIMGFGVTYTRDTCEDEEDEDDDRESRPPKSDDEWSGPEAEEEIEDMVRRFQEYGECEAIRFRVYSFQEDPNYQLENGIWVELDTAWMITKDRGFHDSNNSYPEDDEVIRGLMFDSLRYTYRRTSIRGWIAVAPSPENVKRFNHCMPLLYPERKQPKKPPPPSPPPMREKECCRESIKLMREIHKALAVRELLDDNLIVPNRLIAPNAKGSAKLKNYLDISQYQIRIADHLGVHPFKALVTDANAAKKGNQQIEVQAMNATSATRQIMELLLENKGDSATRLNLQVRIAVAVGQILNAVSIAAKSIEQVVQFLGMPRKQKVLNVKFPFDFTFGKGAGGRGKGKGFGPNSRAQDKLDINTEEATEALLPNFMQDREQPIVVEMFDDDQPTLLDEIHDKKQ